MSTTIVRIPGHQPLWNAFREAARDYAFALLKDEHMRALYAANPTEVSETLRGRDAAMTDGASAVGNARVAMHAAITELAHAQVARVMGTEAANNNR
jgi:hypothetical protein